MLCELNLCDFETKIIKIYNNVNSQTSHNEGVVSFSCTRDNCVVCTDMTRWQYKANRGFCSGVNATISVKCSSIINREVAARRHHA